MKRIAYLKNVLLLLLILPPIINAQNVAINADGSLADRNAILDIKSPTKGLLIPRITTQAREKIPNTQGLIVYDINTNSFWYNTGTSWQNMSPAVEALSANRAWLLTGNVGTTDTVSFLGTTDNVPLTFRVNNVRSGRIDHTKQNTFFGFGSGRITTNEIETGNTAMGHYSLSNNNTGLQNTAIGGYTLHNNITGAYNTAIGYKSLSSNVTGMLNVAAGVEALHNNAYGSGNVALGPAALSLHISGDNNIAIGTQSQHRNGVASDNISLGQYSLWNNYSGEGNIAIGRFSQFINTGNDNVVVGNNALIYYTGSSNTAVGNSCLYGGSGDGNAAFGNGALALNYGSQNTAVGIAALNSNSTGSFNTAVGNLSLMSNSTGTGNTTLGQLSDVSASDLTNATAIGYTATVNASNKVRIGNAAVTVIEGQVPFTTPSDGRYKFQVKEDVKGLDFILQLRPVTYQFDVKRFDNLSGYSEQAERLATSVNYNEATQMRRSGFIAQEVEIAADRSGYNFSGIIKPKTNQEQYGLSYESFVVPLVKAVQEQQQMINTQNKKIVELQQHDRKMEMQDKKIEEQNRKINMLLKEVELLKKKISQ